MLAVPDQLHELAVYGVGQVSLLGYPQAYVIAQQGAVLVVGQQYPALVLVHAQNLGFLIQL